jgi:glutamine amidotransferase
MMSTVVVIDYGMGNLLSVRRGIEACGGEAEVTAVPDKIASAERLILPGVGSFKDGMKELRERDLVEAIGSFLSTGRPFLGICLGMQMLMSESEEHGHHQGLGIIPGKVIEIPRDDLDGMQLRKIPHIGWSALRYSAGKSNWNNTLLQNISEGEYFYFVHSFMSVPDDVEDVLAECEYEELPIAACVRRDSVMGCQFHPEKSGRSGLRILDRFLKI